MLAVRLAKLEEYERIIEKDGVMLTGPDGKQQIHPLIGAIDRRETQQRQYSAMFGLDSSSRAGLPVVNAKEDGVETFDEWMGKNPKHRQGPIN